jgi:hypothetical protein
MAKIRKNEASRPFGKPKPSRIKTNIRNIENNV